jgi:hypothetical protein
MKNRITLIDAARLNGDAPGTYRALVSDTLGSIGEKIGRERMLDVAETVLLRTVTETTSGNLNLREAAARALGLFPFVRQVATSELGGNGDRVFAVDCWGTVGGKNKRAGYICEGQPILAACIGKLVEAQWPNVKVMNLTAIVAETFVGWNIAVNGPEMAEAIFRDTLPGKDPKLQAEAWSLFEEMCARLERSGDRRAAPPAANHWEKWTEERMAA